MEPIPSHPHASRNLAISLFIMVAVVLGGVYWYRYEHIKSLSTNTEDNVLTLEEQEQIVAGSSTGGEASSMLIEQQLQIINPQPQADSKTKPKTTPSPTTNGGTNYQTQMQIVGN